MVWDNPFHNLKPAEYPEQTGFSNPGPGFHLLKNASLSDRILSWILDLLIYLPFVNLFLFKILQQFRDADWIFEPLSSSWWLSKIIYGVYVFIIFTLIQAVSWTLFHQTLGQKFFRLTVRTTDPQVRLSFNRSLLRAFTLNFSLLAGGIPLLAMLSHPQKLGFHDLVSETWVEGAQAGWLMNNSLSRGAHYIRGFYSLITALVLFIFMLLLSTLEQSLVANQEALSKDFSSLVQDEECQVSNFGTDEVDNLLTGYLSGKFEKKCLQELFKDQSQQISSPLYLFAKYLQFEDEPDLSQKYKAEACANQEGQRACQWIALKERNIPVVASQANPEYAFDWLLQYQHSLFFLNQDRMNELVALPMPYLSASLARAQYAWLKLGLDRTKMQGILNELNVTFSDVRLDQMVCQWDQAYYCQTSHSFEQCQSYFKNKYPQGQISQVEDQWLFAGYKACQGQLSQGLKELSPIAHPGLELLNRRIENPNSQMDQKAFNQIFSLQSLSSRLQVRLIKIWEPLLLNKTLLNRGLASEGQSE